MTNEELAQQAAEKIAASPESDTRGGWSINEMAQIIIETCFPQEQPCVGCGFAYQHASSCQFYSNSEPLPQEQQAVCVSETGGLECVFPICGECKEDRYHEFHCSLNRLREIGICSLVRRSEVTALSEQNHEKNSEGDAGPSKSTTGVVKDISVADETN